MSLQRMLAWPFLNQDDFDGARRELFHHRRRLAYGAVIRCFRCRASFRIFIPSLGRVFREWGHTLTTPVTTLRAFLDGYADGQVDNQVEDQGGDAAAAGADADNAIVIGDDDDDNHDDIVDEGIVYAINDSDDENSSSDGNNNGDGDNDGNGDHVDNNDAGDDGDHAQWPQDNNNNGRFGPQ